MPLFTSGSGTEFQPASSYMKELLEIPEEAKKYEPSVHSSFEQKLFASNKNLNDLEFMEAQANAIEKIYEKQDWESPETKDIIRSIRTKIGSGFSVPKLSYEKIDRLVQRGDIWLKVPRSSESMEGQLGLEPRLPEGNEYIRANSEKNQIEVNARFFHLGSKNEEEFEKDYQRFQELKAMLYAVSMDQASIRPEASYSGYCVVL